MRLNYVGSEIENPALICEVLNGCIKAIVHCLNNVGREIVR